MIKKTKIDEQAHSDRLDTGSREVEPGMTTPKFIDNRPEAVQMRKRQEAINNSPQVLQARARQASFNNSPRMRGEMPIVTTSPPLQRKESEEAVKQARMFERRRRIGGNET